MPSNHDIQESLKPLFRAQELQRRDARKQIIINHLELDSENLSSDDAKFNAAALAQLERSRELYAKTIHGNYWRNLWKAIRGL